MQNSQYNKRTDENKHMIENMTNYMLTNKNMVNYLNLCLVKEKVEKKKKITFKPCGNIQQLFFPCQEDNLFWLYYIMVHSIENYKMLGEHTYSIENQEKMKCIETLKLHKSTIKDLKTKIIDCENDLINNKKISLSTFIVLCAIKSINPCIVFKNLYFIYDESENPNFIIHKVNGLYGYEPFNESLYDGVKTNRMCITNINKPIKAISSYKIDEIKMLAESLHISSYNDNQKSKNKIMLYDDIKSVIYENIY